MKQMESSLPLQFRLHSFLDEVLAEVLPEYFKRVVSALVVRDLSRHNHQKFEHVSN
jgi:hypothetical protein